MIGRRPTVSSVHGIVAASNPLAARAGARLLREGGNAFDAAVAVAAALNVVEPYMSGLAGMGMATAYVARETRVRALDFVTRVPSKLPVERFKQREDLHRGALACGTPGNLAGWHELVSKYGRKPFSSALQPAIELAQDGAVLSGYNRNMINEVAPDIRKHKRLYKEWTDTYTFGAGSVRPGQLLKQEKLARTYEAIAAHGPDYLYRGPLGKALVACIEKLGGCLNQKDFDSVEPEWLDPVSADYRGVTVYTLPPPCEGFQYLLTLRILDGLNLGVLERNGVEHLDTVYRAIRLAAGARIQFNRPSEKKLKELLAEGFVSKLRKRAQDGKPLDGPTEQWIEPKPIDLRKEYTTSFSVADREGNLVCITQSLGAIFGSGIVVPDTGVCLNNFLYWGEINPKATNYMRPGGPLALPMAPSIGLRGKKPVLALGTPGSYGICQTQAQVMVQLMDFAQPIQEAIEAPRARLWDGRRVQVEGRIRQEVIEALRGRGHDIEHLPDWVNAVGSMQGVTIDLETGAKTGGCDPRRDGYVATP